MCKEYDDKCQDCSSYDICSKESSRGCTQYEFYKCETCVNKDIKGKTICIRGGLPCSEIRYCKNNTDRD